jgi:hypothetical protein
LASVDITVSVDPADSIVAFEPEKITALSNLFWCRFSRRSAVRMVSISPSKREIGTETLSHLALETMNTRYPQDKWLHIFTDINVGILDLLSSKQVSLKMTL